MKTPRKNLDPIWQKSHDNSSWNMDPKAPIHNRVQEATTTVQATTPSYAIGATTTINKAIDTWIEDHKAHGGHIADRHVAD